jgi:hypothetical protein
MVNMADFGSLTINSDGSATLSVTFDIAGVQCDPSLAANDTDFPLPVRADGNGNIIPWTQAAAQATLGPQIAAAKAAFLAAALEWIPTLPASGE